MDQGKRLFERSEFAIDPTLTEHHSVPEAKRRDSDCGSPFFSLGFFGEAKKSKSPAGASPGSYVKVKSAIKLRATNVRINKPKPNSLP